MRHVLNHRHREYRTLMTVVLAVCGVAVLGSILPIVEHITNALVLGMVAVAVLIVLARLGARWVRERIEDRADARTAYAWRARHAPHLLHQTPAASSRRPVRVGVV